jgi:hypothetical protein
VLPELLAQVSPVRFEEVEAEKLHLAVVAARVQPVERPSRRAGDESPPMA